VRGQGLGTRLVFFGMRVVQVTVKYQNVEELCKTGQYFAWLKMLFTSWITFYLYMLVELSHNLNARKHEAFYVISFVLIPLPIVCAPFFTSTYGSAGALCWIMATDSNCNRLTAGMIEQIAMWYGPLVVLTVLNGLAIVRIAFILCQRAWKCDRKVYDPVLPKQNHRAALKEVLPLSPIQSSFIQLSCEDLQIEFIHLLKTDHLYLR